MWLSRDKDETLHLFYQKPTLNVDKWEGLKAATFNHKMSMTCTFENSPIEVHILTNSQLKSFNLNKTKV